MPAPRMILGDNTHTDHPTGLVEFDGTYYVLQTETHRTGTEQDSTLMNTFRSKNLKTVIDFARPKHGRIILGTTVPDSVNETTTSATAGGYGGGGRADYSKKLDAMAKRRGETVPPKKSKKECMKENTESLLTRIAKVVGADEGSPGAKLWGWKLAKNPKAAPPKTEKDVELGETNRPTKLWKDHANTLARSAWRNLMKKKKAKNSNKSVAKKTSEASPGAHLWGWNLSKNPNAKPPQHNTDVVLAESHLPDTLNRITAFLNEGCDDSGCDMRVATAAPKADSYDKRVEVYVPVNEWKAVIAAIRRNGGKVGYPQCSNTWERYVSTSEKSGSDKSVAQPTRLSINFPTAESAMAFETWYNKQEYTTGSGIPMWIIVEAKEKK